MQSRAAKPTPTLRNKLRNIGSDNKRTFGDYLYVKHG
jgi:hypothetical protein